MMRFGYRPISFLTTAILLAFVFVSHFSAADESAWSDAYEYIDRDTVWHKGDALVFDKRVIVDENATLTIEPGASVRFNGGGLSVWWGNVVAEGTESDPIVFASDNATSFSLEFLDYEDGYDDRKGKTSRLAFADIVSAGTFEDPDECGIFSKMRARDPWWKRFLRGENAFAAGDCAWGTAALYYTSGRVEIDSVNFIGTRYADMILNAFFSKESRSDFLSVTRTNFGDNAQRTAVISWAKCAEEEFSAKECAEHISMRNNWWGGASGPMFSGSVFETATIGSGNAIAGDGALAFRPFANAPVVNRSEKKCTENCFSNVLFLPGLKASRLYAVDDPDCAVNCENQLWEPNRNDDVRKLFLNENGESANAYDIYTRDIVEELDVAGNDIYHSFVSAMNELKADGSVNDWAAIPYDWRFSPEKIVSGGFVSGENVSFVRKSGASLLQNELRRLANSSKTGKVTLVAHSNGGLVAKELLQRLGDEETARLVDSVVLVAVPQVGAASATGALLHGYDQGILAGLILSESVARSLAEHMPSAYALLPSQGYFSSVSAPLIRINEQKLPDWSARFGPSIDDANEMEDFLQDSSRRVFAESADTDAPIALRASFLGAAAATHRRLDEWRAPSGVRVVQVAGWGVPSTIAGLEYSTKTETICEKNACRSAGEGLSAQPFFIADGDGTVPVPSALWMGKNAERYWVNLAAYNKLSNRIKESRFSKVNHANILEVPEVIDVIKDAAAGKAIGEYAYLSTKAPEARESFLQYTLHSPLSLHLYDDAGRHTGMLPDGTVEEGIPGTSYRQFGEAKYIFSDAAGPTRLMMNGYASGVFTLEIEERQADESVGKITFARMPSTEKTLASVHMSGGVASAGDLTIDKDGDGSIDFRAHPAIGRIVSFNDSDDKNDAEDVAVESETNTMKKKQRKSAKKKDSHRDTKKQTQSLASEEGKAAPKLALANPLEREISFQDTETAAFEPKVAGASAQSPDTAASSSAPSRPFEETAQEPGWMRRVFQVLIEWFRSPWRLIAAVFA